MALDQLSDKELVSRLSAMCVESRRLLARFLAHLAELEERRLYLDDGYSSLYDFCHRALGMSENAAFTRSMAARTVRRFPALLPRLENGELSLSTMLLLRPHLGADDMEELVAGAAGKSKREVEALLARRRPKPDVPSRIDRVDAPPLALPSLDAGATATLTPPAERPPRIAPLSEDRHEVRFTVSTATREKLERARDLMRHRNPSGDLGVVVDRALDLLLRDLERTIEKKVETPRKTARECEPAAAHVPDPIRREVFARDGEQCAYVAPDGRRCGARAFLEIDHSKARAFGGRHVVDDLRVFCRGHNQRHAVKTMGKDFVERKIQERRASTAATRAARSPEAVRGLVGLGFRERDVLGALDAVAAKHAADTPPALADVIREAIAILAP